MGVINSVSNTLTSVLTLVKVPLSGFRLVNLERHPWVPQQEPLTRVLCAFPIHNILLVCFLLAHCDQISVRHLPPLLDDYTYNMGVLFKVKPAYG